MTTEEEHGDHIRMASTACCKCLADSIVQPAVQNATTAVLKRLQQHRPVSVPHHSCRESAIAEVEGLHARVAALCAWRDMVARQMDEGRCLTPDMICEDSGLLGKNRLLVNTELNSCTGLLNPLVHLVKLAILAHCEAL